MIVYHISKKEYNVGEYIEPLIWSSSNFQSERKRNIELECEEYRCKKYSYKKTRLGSIFVSATEESSFFWGEEKYCLGGRTEYYLYEIEVEEPIEWHNVLYYNKIYNCTKFRDKEQCMEEYWKGITYEEACKLEESEGICTTSAKIIRKKKMTYSRETGIVEIA